MKVEIDFEEALKEFCEEKRKSYYCKPTASDVAGYITLLFATLPSYEDIATAIVGALSRESDYTRDVVKEKLFPQGED